VQDAVMLTGKKWKIDSGTKVRDNE